jgi:hypothetical protein
MMGSDRYVQGNYKLRQWKDISKLEILKEKCDFCMAL